MLTLNAFISCIDTVKNSQFELQRASRWKQPDLWSPFYCTVVSSDPSVILKYTTHTPQWVCGATGTYVCSVCPCWSWLLMGCLVIRSSDLHESTHKVCRVHGTVDWELHNLVTTQLSKCMHQGGFATACRTNLGEDKRQIGTALL